MYIACSVFYVESLVPGRVRLLTHTASGAILLVDKTSMFREENKNRQRARDWIFIAEVKYFYMATRHKTQSERAR